MIPIISEKVLSYTMNSLFSSDNLCTLGIAIALLTTPKGTAYTIAIFKDMSTNCKRIKQIMAVVANKISKAEIKDFPISGIFVRVIFKSSEPSNTINIKPIIPSKSSGSLLSEKTNPNSFDNICNPIPVSKSKITDGIFSFPEIRLKTYDNITKILIAIRIV